MRLIRSLLGIWLPWFLLLAVATFELTNLLGRQRSARRLRDGIAGKYGLLLREANVLGKVGPLDIIACIEIEGDNMLLVESAGTRIVSIWMQEHPPRDEYMTVSIYADGAPFVDCGSIEKGHFPTNLVVYPKGGVNGSFAMYGDYDLDGVFERKKVFDKQVSTEPARESSGN